MILKKKYSKFLSTQRPQEIGFEKYQGHLFSAELGLIHWLEREHYDFDIVSDLDIEENPNILLEYQMIMLNTHSEYWTPNALDGLYNYLNKGGNLCYLGANGLYWKVTISKDGIIECQKEGGQHITDNSIGGKWRSGGLGKPEEQILGVAFSKAGYDTYYPYEVKDSNHWLFIGTNLRNGDHFGVSLNREYASGLETDKVNSNSPENIILLAKGLNMEAKNEIGIIGADKNGGADMVYYEHPGGGKVFATGSVTSGGSLLVDSKMHLIMRNLITEMTK